MGRVMKLNKALYKCFDRESDIWHNARFALRKAKEKVVERHVVHNVFCFKAMPQKTM